MVGDDDDPNMMHSDCGGYIQYSMNIRVGVHISRCLVSPWPVVLVVRLNTPRTDQTTKRPSGKIYNTTFTVPCLRRLSRSGDIQNQVIPFCFHLLSDSLYKPKHVEKVSKSMSFDGTNQKVLLIPWIYFTTATTTVSANVSYLVVLVELVRTFTFEAIKP